MRGGLLATASAARCDIINWGKEIDRRESKTNPGRGIGMIAHGDS